MAIPPPLKPVPAPATPAAASKPPRAKSTGIRWHRINLWFHRLLALAWLAKGLVSWAVILGVEPFATLPFEGRAPTFQALTIYFAVLDLLAAVGLWLLAPWGAVVWLIAAVSRLVAGFVFPAAAALAPLAAGWLGGIVVLFMVLSWLAGRSEPR